MRPAIGCHAMQYRASPFPWRPSNRCPSAAPSARPGPARHCNANSLHERVRMFRAAISLSGQRRKVRESRSMCVRCSSCTHAAAAIAVSGSRERVSNLNSEHIRVFALRAPCAHGSLVLRRPGSCSARFLAQASDRQATVRSPRRRPSRAHRPSRGIAPAISSFRPLATAGTSTTHLHLPAAPATPRAPSPSPWTSRCSLRHVRHARAHC